MHTLLLALVCAALNLTCTPKPIPPPVPPPAPPVGEVTCADACQRLDQLGCRAGKPTPKGHTCLEICRAANDSGVIHWNLDCLQAAGSCADADLCR